MRWQLFTGDEFLKALSEGELLTEDWYRQIFSHPQAVTRVSGEITPSYLILDEEDIAYAKSLIPDARIIVIVREPVNRALSQLRMAIDRSKSVPDSDAAWSNLADRIHRQRRGDYRSSIPLWQKYFSPDQLLIIPFGDIKNRPAELIETIEMFLGVPHFRGYTSLAEAVHQSKKLEIPSFVVEQFKHDTEPQREYIKAAFGEDFYKRCS